MKLTFNKTISALIIALSCCTLNVEVSAQEASTQIVGKVVFVRGTATAQRTQSIDPIPLKFDDAIYPRDTLQTGVGELKVLFRDKTILHLNKNSKVLISKHLYEPTQRRRSAIYEILTGSVRAIVERITALADDDVQLHSPTAVAGIRGTDVGIRVSNPTEYLVFDGQLEVFFKGAKDKKVMVETGQKAIVNLAPPVVEPINPADRDEFLNHFPPLADWLSQPGAEHLVRPEFEVLPRKRPDVGCNGGAPDCVPFGGMEGVGDSYDGSQVPQDPDLFLPGFLDESPVEDGAPPPEDTPTEPTPTPEPGGVDVPLEFPEAG